MHQTTEGFPQPGTGLELVAPNVTLIAATQITDEQLATEVYDENYPSYTPYADGLHHEEGEYLVEFAGRRCYSSFHNPAGRTTDTYISNILEQKHFSVLEHACVTFHLEGVSRAFTHELVRHRHFSFSQLSQRYVDSTEAPYVCPPMILADKRLLMHWLRSLDKIREELLLFSKYMEMHCADVPKKQKREAIRSLAPNAIETKIVVTGNIRAWRDYLEKRWNSHADAEIQQVSGMIAVQLKELYPSAFADVAYT